MVVSTCGCWAVLIKRVQGIIRWLRSEIESAFARCLVVLFTYFHDGLVIPRGELVPSGDGAIGEVEVAQEGVAGEALRNLMSGCASLIGHRLNA